MHNRTERDAPLAFLRAVYIRYYIYNNRKCWSHRGILILHRFLLANLEDLIDVWSGRDRGLSAVRDILEGFIRPRVSGRKRQRCIRPRDPPSRGEPLARRLCSGPSRDDRRRIWVSRQLHGTCTGGIRDLETGRINPSRPELAGGGGELSDARTHAELYRYRFAGGMCVAR